jgi:hypothetical protein
MFNKKIFGKSLPNESKNIPLFITEILNHLENKNFHKTEGIFRIEGDHEVIKEVKTKIDQGKKIDYNKIDQHCLTTVLKHYLNELPEPLFPFELYGNFIATSEETVLEERINSIKKLLKILPSTNYQILNTLMCFLKKIQKEEENSKMSSTNLSIIFSVNLLKKKQRKNVDSLQLLKEYQKESPLSNSLIKFMIEEYEKIFVKENESSEELEIEKMNLTNNEKLLVKRFYILYEKKVITLEEYELKKKDMISKSEHGKKEGKFSNKKINLSNFQKIQKTETNEEKFKQQTSKLYKLLEKNIITKLEYEKKYESLKIELGIIDKTTDPITTSQTESKANEKGLNINQEMEIKKLKEDNTNLTKEKEDEITKNKEENMVKQKEKEEDIKKIKEENNIKLKEKEEEILKIKDENIIKLKEKEEEIAKIKEENIIKLKEKEEEIQKINEENNNFLQKIKKEGIIKIKEETRLLQKLKDENKCKLNEKDELITSLIEEKNIFVQKLKEEKLNQSKYHNMIIEVINSIGDEKSIEIEDQNVLEIQKLIIEKFDLKKNEIDIHETSSDDDKLEEITENYKIDEIQETQSSNDESVTENGTTYNEYEFIKNLNLPEDFIKKHQKKSQNSYEHINLELNSTRSMLDSESQNNYLNVDLNCMLYSYQNFDPKKGLIVDIANISKISVDEKISNLPFSKDLIRLAHKIKIIKNNEEIKCEMEGDEGNSQLNNIFFIFKTLKGDFDQLGTSELDYDEFKNQISMSDYQTINQYILDKIGEESHTTKIFKTIHQNLVGLITGGLKKMFEHHNIRFKDYRNGWEIKVCYEMDSEKPKNLSVIHIRKDVVHQNFKEMFVFQWQIICKYNVEEFIIDDIYLNLIDINFIENIKNFKKKFYFEKVKSIFGFR